MGFSKSPFIQLNNAEKKHLLDIFINGANTLPLQSKARISSAVQNFIFTVIFYIIFTQDKKETIATRSSIQHIFVQIPYIGEDAAQTRHFFAEVLSVIVNLWK